jgi:Tol biopolymer transport system component
MDMRKTALSHCCFCRLPTVFAVAALGLLLVSLISFPVKAERWTAPTQVTFNLNIADDWGGPSLSSDGSTIVFQHKVDGYYEVFVVNSDGTGLTQVTRDDQRHYVHLSISGDGSKIAVASYLPTSPNSFANAEAFVVNSDGTGMTSLISRPLLNCKPSISDDGTKVAVVAYTEDLDTELFVVNSDGTGLKQLTNNMWSERQPSISSDGSKIAFASYVDDGYEIFVVNSDGAGLKQVTNSTADSQSPSISGDGSKIAFESKTAYMDGDEYIIYNAICVVNSDGTGLTPVVNNTDYNTQPSINYDGSKVTFASSAQPPDTNIFVVNSDGTGLHQITQDARTDSYPSISGDGSRIAFISFENAVNGEIFVSIDLDQDTEAPVTVDNYVDNWHIADFQITLVANDELSGVAETYYKVNGGSAKTLTAHGPPSITEEGAGNTLEYWSVDVAGNEEPHTLLTEIKLDKTAPTGSVTINNEAESTSSTSVTLSLSANDTSGVAQMRFGNNGTEWTSWEAYATSKNWTLSSGDGEKTVYAQFKDAAGWVSGNCSDTILLDTVKEGTFPIEIVIAGTAGFVVTAVILLYIRRRKFSAKH